VTGLRSRLEALDGVDSIELELGDDGLEGITVRLAEGADEMSVLDGVRRLLVAYGTRSARILAASGAEVASSPPPVSHEVIDVDAEPSEMVSEPPVTVVSSGEHEAAMVTPEGERIELSIAPAGDRSTSQVVYSRGERTVRRQVPSSARAIVQAVIDAAAELAGRDPISVIGLNLSAIEGMRVLTVIAGNHATAPKVSTVSVVESNWPAALLEVASQVLE
jgi:hypothetical protein